MHGTILVVDDEAAARFTLTRVFQPDYRVVEARSVEEARQKLASDRPDVVLLDYDLPGEDGLSLLRECGTQPDAPAIIMITAHGSERLAVEAMRAGAYDYHAKPYDIDELRLVVTRAMERQELRGEVAGYRDWLAGEGHFGRMVGASAEMRELFQTAERVARTDLPVLLQGESGCGKDILAQEIHARSARAKKSFVAVNSAAFPENLVESELFGHEKGAFTNAVTARAGKFEQANRGTLFLDEIGDMALPTQARILRAVENGVIERLGGSKPTPVDVRLISATNKDLEEAIRQNTFREDLFFRLAAVTLYLPPLRKRPEDIPLLVERFWNELQRQHSRKGPEMDADATTRLQEAQWPGNVRQLYNTVQRLFLLPRDGKVTADDVTRSLGPQTRAAGAQSTDGPFSIPNYHEANTEFERRYLKLKLEENRWNVTRTASAIGVARPYLQELIKKLAIRRPGL